MKRRQDSYGQDKEDRRMKTNKIMNTHKKASWGILAKDEGKGPDKLLLFTLLLIIRQNIKVQVIFINKRKKQQDSSKLMLQICDFQENWKIRKQGITSQSPSSKINIS